MMKVVPSFARALTGNGSRQIGPCMAVCSTGIRLKGLAYPNVTAATIVSIALAVGKTKPMVLTTVCQTMCWGHILMKEVRKVHGCYARFPVTLSVRVIIRL